MSLLSIDAVDRLRDAFRSIGYLTDPVLEAIGEQGQRGLGRNTTVAASCALDARENWGKGIAEAAQDPLSAAIRLWLLRQPVPVAALSALPMEDLVAAGIVAVDGDLALGEVDIRPYGSPDDGADGWVVSDPTPGLDRVITRTRPDYVLGVSPASTSLAQMTSRRRVGSALDLGCGCGVQSLHLTRHAGRVIATDVNPRALEMAELTLALSEAGTADSSDDGPAAASAGHPVELRQGSLFEPFCGPPAERFDLIVSNPPYVMSPPRPAAERLTYREAGFEGDGLVEAVVRGVPDHLAEGGTAQILANWAVLGDQPWQDRLAGWVAGRGCDLWVVERESLDVHEYIETWLTDAGLDGSPCWHDSYTEWLGYFARLGITGVSMGWLTLTAAGRSQPDLSFESWPWSIQQPVGPAIGQHREGVDDAQLADPQLLAGRWKVHDDIICESTSRPGAAGPEHIVYRQHTGLCRAMEVDTLLGGVLGACDGELALGTIIEVVASILEADADQATAQVLPRVRTALREGFLVRS